MKIIAVLAASVVGAIILPAVSFLHARNREWAGSRIRQDAQPKKASFANPVLELEIRHERGVTAIAFSPDNKLLAIGADDYTIQLWDAQTGQVERRLNGGKKGEISEWDAQTGALVRKWEPLYAGIHSVTFSPDGQFLVAGCSDATIKFWDVKTRELRRTLRGGGRVFSLCFSPDGKTLASCVGPGLSAIAGQIEPLLKVHLLDAETEQFNLMPVSHRGFVTAVAFAPDGQYLASGDEGLYSSSSHRHENGAVKVWRIK
jgi:WD40 repeat protein